MSDALSEYGFLMVVIDDDDMFTRLSEVGDCAIVKLVGQSRNEGIEHAESRCCAGRSIGRDNWEHTLQI